MVERQKKLAIPYAITAGLCTLGAGILYDKVRNNKAKKVANDVYAGNVNNVRAEDGEIGISSANIPYYKSKNGIKYGAIAGAVCGLVRGAMDCISAKRFDARAVFGGPALFALGGMLLGAMVQKFANSDAEKSTYFD